MNDSPERIIGDCLELNAEITETIYKSKLPSFIKNLQKKYYKRKMTNIVAKIKNANIPLTKSNVMELVIYVYNNYQPNCQYESIKAIKYYPDSKYYMAKIEFDDVAAIFRIPDSGDMFSARVAYVKASKAESQHNYELEVASLSSDIEPANELLTKINHELLRVIYTYIMDIVGNY